MFFIYSESDDFDIGSPSATAFPAYLEEEDCGGEIIERGSVEFEGGKSEVRFEKNIARVTFALRLKFI